MQDLVAVPERGRRFESSRRVRWGDADQRGRLRLDAIARYLQDISNDDTRDAGADPGAPWVVRRTTIDVGRHADVGEMVTLTTFCGGLGSRWAERRTSLSGDRGAQVEAASLWVFMDPASGRPARLTPAFIDTYGEAACGRTVTVRLSISSPPEDRPCVVRPWTIRSTDLDGLGHVNNAATWEAVEDELARRDLVATSAEIEYLEPITAGEEVQIVSESGGDRLTIWLVAGQIGGPVLAAAAMATQPAPGG